MSEFNWNQFETEQSPEGFSWDKFEEDKSSSYADFTKRFHTNAGIGLMNLYEGMANLPHNVVGLFSEEYADKIPHKEDRNYAEIFGLTSPSDLATQSIFEYGPSLAFPAANLGKVGKAIESIPKVGKYLERGAALAAPQAAFSYGMGLENNPEEAAKSAGLTAAITAPFGAAGQAVRSASPAVRAAGSGAAAIGGGALGYQTADAFNAPDWATIPISLGAGLLAERGINPKGYSQKKVFEDIEPEQAAEVVNAARRLGLDYVTPAEAVGTPFAGEKQASIGKTAEGSKIKYDAGMQRLKSEEKTITSFLDDIYSGAELTPEKQALYKKAMSTQMPNEIGQEFLANDEVIKAASKEVMSKPAYKQALKDVPKDSFEYWNQIKIAMDDMRSGALRQGHDNEARIIKKSKDSMIGVMDQIEPDYARARGLAEREFIRKDLDKVFDKKPITGRNFYKALESDEKFGKLRESLSEFPDLQTQLDDMRTVFPRLINPQTGRAAHGLEATSMNKSRGGWKQDLDDAITRSIGRRSDVEAAKLITNPQWYEMLAKRRGQSESSSALAALLEMLGKGLGQTAASNKKEQ